MNKAADFLAAVSVQVKLQVQLLVCLILQIFEQCVICDWCSFSIIADLCLYRMKKRICCSY